MFGRPLLPGWVALSDRLSRAGEGDGAGDALGVLLRSLLFLEEDEFPDFFDGG